MHELSLIERLESLSSKYPVLTPSNRVEKILESVKRQLVDFLETPQGSLIWDENYGLPPITQVYKAALDAAQSVGYLQYLSKTLKELDSRIATVRVELKKHSGAKTGDVQFLFITTEINRSKLKIQSNTKPFFVLALDFTGKVFEVKLKT